MTIEVLDGTFSVCKVADLSGAAMDSAFCALVRTDEENSLVCETCRVPENVTAREDGWRAFRIAGVLDFSLIGILAKIASILAEEGISIFAVSTYNTDYILTKDMDRALAALKAAGYEITSADAAGSAG